MTTAANLKPGQYFKLPLQRAFRLCAAIHVLNSSTGPKEHLGKLLILINGPCRQYILDPNQPIETK